MSVTGRVPPDQEQNQTQRLERHHASTAGRRVSALQRLRDQDGSHATGRDGGGRMEQEGAGERGGGGSGEGKTEEGWLLVPLWLE